MIGNNTLSLTTDQAFANIFYQREIPFFEGSYKCYCKKDGSVVAEQDRNFSKNELEEVIRKIKSLNWDQVLCSASPIQRQYLLHNLISLRKYSISHLTADSAFLGLFKKPSAQLPFLIEATTAGSLNRFSGSIKSELISLNHFTTYPKSDPIETIPTDHAGWKELDDGWRVGVCDGLGHWDPKGIGLAASKVLKRVLDQPMNSKNEFQTFLRRLNESLKYQEGTMILAAEVHKEKKAWSIKVGCHGDSALILLNKQGHIVFSTKNRIVEHKSNTNDPIGMLGVGGGLSDSLIEFSEYEELSIQEGWLIACSDGLIEHYRKTDGAIDELKFQDAVSNAFNLEMLAEKLRQEAIAEAKKSGKGDDVSIIILNLTKI